MRIISNKELSIVGGGILQIKSPFRIGVGAVGGQPIAQTPESSIVQYPDPYPG